MKILLDTHTFLWYVSADSKLSENAKNAILNPENIKYISIATFWEIAIKVSLNKLQLNAPYEVLFDLTGYQHLDISLPHLLQLMKLDFHHKDPFDRLIISQALADKIPIVSNDDYFDKYKIKRIW